MLHFNPLIRSQMKNPKSIPIVIINFNQLFYLKKLVDFLVTRNFINIVIVDNLSTYPPLLEYYKNLPPTVILERMKENYGHLVFFENTELQEKYGKGFYVVTDADIVPNENLPEDFIGELINLLKKNFCSINKVGFALDLKSIPDYYQKKQNVLQWEKVFWQNRVQAQDKAFHAFIDTTFALYKPSYPSMNSEVEFFYAIRLAGDYTALHGGWYIDYKNLTDEQKYYQQTAGNSSSWNLNQDGKFHMKSENKYT